MNLHKKLQPSRNSFAADPFGYSSSAWLKWGIAQTLAGFPVDISKPPTAEDLKSPILWLTQAEALTQAAVAVIKNQPGFDEMPIYMRGVCDSQYCAVGLMLVGYSLEVCLKAMTILQSGVMTYMANEKSFYHHRLVKLAEFIPDLSVKDKAILQTLTHFTLWAGRYPDPGSGRVKDVEEVFNVAEEHEIAAKDLFALAARVMGHTQAVVDEATR
ncbi:hypothetical protein [Pseudomonas sp. R151218B TE3479]